MEALEAILTRRSTRNYRPDAVEDERVYGAVIIGYPASESGLPNRKLMQQKGNVVTYIN